MAGANKRTSVFLTVLAVVFVIIIIILCLVPKPCHGPECDSSQVDQAKSRGEAPPDVITDAVTQTTSTTTTIAGAPATSTTASTTTTTTTTAAPTTTTTTATTAAPTTTITTTTTAAPTTTTTTPLAPTTVEPTTLSSTTKQSVTYTTEDDYPVLVTDESAAMTSTTQEPTTLRLTTEETTTLSATTEETTTLSATTEETTTLSETTEETTTLSATTEEETTLSATTEEETTLSATTEEETTLSATTEEETTLSATTEEETTLSATTEEDTTLLATTEESSTWSLTTEESTDESTLMTTTDESTSDNSTTIFNETKSEGICNTTSCKRLAARMLDMMDLGNVDPCEDFYQYSCGGVLDDLFLDPEDPKVQADNLIKNKLVSGSPSDSVAEPIQQYYNSCLTFTLDYNETERLEQARNLFSNVSFEFNPNPALKKDELLPEYDTKFNLTTCLANMMKLHFAPFFDLHLDVDGSDNSKFALKLTPPLFSSPFSDDLAKAVCLKNYTNRLQEAELSTKQLDINSEYKIYQRCKSFDDGLSARLERMEHAVEHLKLMEHINNTFIQDKLLAQTRFNTNFFLEAIAEHMPEIPDLRRGNIRKEYQEFTLEQLDHGPVFTSSVINWQQLVEEMLGHEITNPADVKVQVYFHEQLDEIVTEISEEYRTDPLNMQNILLLLWSERIYTSLVEPFGTSLSSPDYCFRATTFLMEDFASYLYLDALQPHLSSKKSKIENMIKIHKKTAEEQLLRKFNDADNSMIDKLHMMLGEVAEIDRIKEALQLNMQGVELSDNFLDNSVTLLQRYRTMMYAVYYKQPSHPQVMWSHFLLPHDVHGVTSYALNKFFIPYGALSAPLFFDDVPDYINYAGIGHMIAHEIAHGFDATGIGYNGIRKETMPDSLAYVPTTECLQEQLLGSQTFISQSGLTSYLELQRNLTFNEILTDSAATRLAWEAYLTSTMIVGTTPEPAVLDSEARVFRRRRSVTSEGDTSLTPRKKRQAVHVYLPPTHVSEERLPWLDLTPIQTYFLRNAQNHCSRSSQIDMLTAMENEHLPNKLRVNLILRNEPLFAKAFNCPVGSLMHPHEQCPYILG